MKAFRWMFGTITSQKMAEIELEKARQALLEAQSGLEYAQAIVQYNTQRVARLQRLVVPANDTIS